jgi:hypothetical protein
MELRETHTEPTDQGRQVAAEISYTAKLKLSPR